MSTVDLPEIGISEVTIVQTIGALDERLKILRHTPNEQAAEEACWATRRAVALCIPYMHLQGERACEHLEALLQKLHETVEAMKRVPQPNELVNKYIANTERRIKAITVLLSGDGKQLIGVLVDALESRLLEREAHRSGILGRQLR